MRKRLFAAWIRGSGDVLVACYESQKVAIDAFWKDRFGCDGDEPGSVVGPWNADLFFCGDFEAGWSARTCKRRLSRSMDSWFPLVLCGVSAEVGGVEFGDLFRQYTRRVVSRDGSGLYVDVKPH